jgi:predicted phosphate transport protein (TIGR00153 family)
MGFQLFPREESFFHLFEKASETLLQAGRLLVETTEDFNGLAEKARKMERLEHDADQIVHEIRARLHRTFITPIDREDIHQLASAMDDVLDFIEATTERFVLYKVSSIPLPARQLAQVIAAQVEEIHHIIAQLRNLGQQDILKRCIEINRLENEGDRLLREAVAALFESRADPLEVMKWRELYELLEQATDKAEDVAVVIEGIVLKNA